MSQNQTTLMAHVILEQDVQWPILLNGARAMLINELGIEHLTARVANQCIVKLTSRKRVA